MGPGHMKWMPHLDGNVNFVMQGNETWLNAASLMELVQELQAVLDRQQMPQVAMGRGLFSHFFKFLFVGLIWFACMLILGMNEMFSLLPICGFGGIALLACVSFWSMRRRRQQLLEGVASMREAFQTFAAEWNRRPDHAMLELSYRSGSTDPPYFELSPAAAMAQPSQALHMNNV